MQHQSSILLTRRTSNSIRMEHLSISSEPPASGLKPSANSPRNYPLVSFLTLQPSRSKTANQNAFPHLRRRPGSRIASPSPPKKPLWTTHRGSRPPPLPSSRTLPTRPRLPSTLPLTTGSSAPNASAPASTPPYSASPTVTSSSSTAPAGTHRHKQLRCWPPRWTRQTVPSSSVCSSAPRRALSWSASTMGVATSVRASARPARPLGGAVRVVQPGVRLVCRLQGGRAGVYAPRVPGAVG